MGVAVAAPADSSAVALDPTRMPAGGGDGGEGTRRRAPRNRAASNSSAALRVFLRSRSIPHKRAGPLSVRDLGDSRCALGVRLAGRQDRTSDLPAVAGCPWRADGAGRDGAWGAGRRLRLRASAAAEQLTRVPGHRNGQPRRGREHRARTERRHARRGHRSRR